MRGGKDGAERHVFIFSCWDADSAHKVGWTVDMVNGNGCSRFVSVPGGRLLARAAYIPLVKNIMFAALARKFLDEPNLCKLAHAFLREYSYKMLKFAQLLGQLGVFLTFAQLTPP